MKITFTRGTALGGIGNDAYPGDVRDLPDAQAQSLIVAGRARPVPEPAPEPAPAHEARKAVRIISRAKGADPTKD
jgi:hypothetical protein